MLDFYYDSTVVNCYEWVLCNAALCVFPIFLHEVALSNVLDPDIEMGGKSGAG